MACRTMAGLGYLTLLYIMVSVYYKNLADRTRLDKEEHKEDDVSSNISAQYTLDL